MQQNLLLGVSEYINAFKADMKQTVIQHKRLGRRPLLPKSLAIKMKIVIYKLFHTLVVGPHKYMHGEPLKRGK